MNRRATHGDQRDVALVCPALEPPARGLPIATPYAAAYHAGHGIRSRSAKHTKEHAA
jgi:hypothetical protein